ncbi:Dabb family protein [Vibrio cholerae]|nr:stress responsive A/B Barrel domain protein [Vibrio cholerae O1 str. NHCC-008D]MCX9465680.1 Dabb family protein [Vibrio cholerae]
MLIKFKASTEPSEIEKLKGLFASMPDKVDGVLSVEWGENDSPEGALLRNSFSKPSSPT